jgi:hypothetical protein
MHKLKVFVGIYVTFTAEFFYAYFGTEILSIVFVYSLFTSEIKLEQHRNIKLYLVHICVLESLYRTAAK